MKLSFPVITHVMPSLTMKGKETEFTFLKKTHFEWAQQQPLDWFHGILFIF